MENVTIKRKTFELISPMGENSWKASKDGQFYFIKKFEVKSNEYFDYLYAANRIKSSLVLAPRVILKDKKSGYVVTNFLQGQTVLDYLCENDPSEDDLIYKQIFQQAHLAKMNGLALDFKPENWLITDKGLALCKIWFQIYNKNLDFTQTDIRLWFLTKDLAKYAREHGRHFNVNRLKDEYITNKNIVLTTCKYYQ